MTVRTSPGRIQELVELKRRGVAVTCRSYFEVVPMDFSCGDESFQGLMFLCYYRGTIDGGEYGFRKCYARGCTEDPCPTVYQAVMTAGRYAHIDYEKLGRAGIQLERRRLTIEEIVAKFEKIRAEQNGVSVIHDYIAVADRGNDVFIEPILGFITAREHFPHYTLQTKFLTVHFNVTCLGETHHNELCLACYTMEREGEEKQEKTQTANDRLGLFYAAFEEASIEFEQKFF